MLRTLGKDFPFIPYSFLLLNPLLTYLLPPLTFPAFLPTLICHHLPLLLAFSKLHQQEEASLATPPLKRRSC